MLSLLRSQIWADQPHGLAIRRNVDGGGMSCCFGRCHRHCFMHCWRVVHTNALPGAIQLLGVGKCAVPQNADRDLPLSLRVGVEKATQCWQGVANSGLEVMRTRERMACCVGYTQVWCTAVFTSVQGCNGWRVRSSSNITVQAITRVLTKCMHETCSVTFLCCKLQLVTAVIEVFGEHADGIRCILTLEKATVLLNSSKGD